jgi:dihydrodipicolinate synthase/N-acetylneuraminate lyase
MNATSNGKTHRGVVVPMVTPITEGGALDERAVVRLLSHLHAGGVHGVFVLGTTGEGPSVPAEMRDRLVALVSEIARPRLRVYAGISSNSLGDSVEAGNRYLKSGVDAVVAHVPSTFDLVPGESLQFFTELAHRLDGSLIIYNMPITTRISLPVDVCKATSRRPRVIGIKDSENNADRLDLLLKELGGQPSFSVFVGTGPLMAKGLLLGADGIVPSVGNLAPAVCRELYDCATNGARHRVESVQARMMALANLYQQGRTLGQSLAALKGAMTWLGLCGPEVFPPLRATTAEERLALRAELVRLDVPLPGFPAHEHTTLHWADDGRSGGHRAGAVPAGAG